MIILLTGPTGSGKTDTSWALLQQFQNIVFLDCDWFASRVPFDWEKDLESVYQALSLMIDFHIKRNETHFVITLTLQMAALFEQFKTYFTKHQLPVHAFRLRCIEHELERRIRSRDRILWQKEEELNNMLKHQEDFDRLFPNDEIFKLIDTSTLSEREVAMMITSMASISLHTNSTGQEQP